MTGMNNTKVTTMAKPVPSADKLVGAYILLRDQKKELTDRHKQELEPFNTKLNLIESGLAQILPDRS